MTPTEKSEDWSAKPTKKTRTHTDATRDLKHRPELRRNRTYLLAHSIPSTRPGTGRLGGPVVTLESC